MQLALFDLDNTLLTGDSDSGWISYLVDQGILDRQTFEQQNAVFFAQYQAGTLDIDEYHAFQMQSLTCLPRAALERHLDDYLETRIRPMITEKARSQVNRHLENGDLCALVTATNCFITSPICREFGIPHLIATVAAQENGEFTGKPRGTPSFREGKITRVEDWLESMGLWWSNFERSWFYSDSLNDLPLLSRVSDPVAVDPDPTLLAHAGTHGWPVLNLREETGK